MIRKFLILIALLMQTAVTQAQTSFIQSRYIDAPASAPCSGCQPVVDGVTHIRFDPNSVRLSSDDGGKDYVTFTVQIRRVGGNGTDVGYISASGFRLKYDNAIFGDNLNTPPITEDGSADSQCSYTRSEFFTGVTGSPYNLVFIDVFPSELNINEAHNFQAVLNVIPFVTEKGNFALLGSTWEDMLTLTCEIPANQKENEAGIGFAGSNPRDIFYRMFPVSGNAVPSTAFLLADNDMRGLRLDGKTWAEDYVRYGDGKGVRLKFSKGIKTQLTADDFNLTADGASTIPTITRVLHTAGEAYAQVEFMEAIADGTLTISTTNTIVDMDDVELAGGNFLAALNYDEDAPRVTAAAIDSIALVGDNNHSTWEIDFSSEISTATVDASDICVTEVNGLCVAEGETPTVPVVSVSVSDNGEEMELVINEGDGQVGGVRSIEFRRNAVLGADFKVVEDYQAPLRDEIIIDDTLPPEISITMATAVAGSQNPLQHTINFTVTADEPVPSLNIPASYQLLRVLKDDSTAVETASSTIVGDDREVNIEYTYTFGSDNVLGETAGFTLARVGTSLQDTANRDPVDINDNVIATGGRLDPDGGVTDIKASLTISGVMLSAATIDEGNTATVTFDVNDGTGIYQYAYKLIAGADEVLLAQLAPPVELTIPTDIVAAEDVQQAVTLQIIVSDDGSQTVETSKTLTIQKVNNGTADINLSITNTTLTAIVGADPDGDAITPNYRYQWQSNTGSGWMDIASATDASYIISGDLASASGEFRVQISYTDRQGYAETLTSNEISYTPPSELQPLMVSDIQLSVLPPANADGTINEGSTATFTFNVSGGTDDYQYESKIDDAEYTSFQPPFIYSIPDDLVAIESTSQIVTLTIRVSDQAGNIEAFEHTEKLHIRITNNGPADINLSITNTILTAIVGADPDGDLNFPTYTYQWQTNTGSGWMNIDFATDTSYTISDNLAETSAKFRVQVTYTDGQGYSEMPTSNEVSYTPPSELQPLMVSDIQLSVLPPANADGTINEGSTATLTFEVSGGTDDYQYESKIDDAAYTSFKPPFIYSISDDFIAVDTTSQIVTLTIRVSDQAGNIEAFEHTEKLHIRITNNGSADINLSITNTTLTATIGADPDGDLNFPTHTYQWQSNTGSGWMNIDAATDASYTISDNLAETSAKFRVQITYADGQGYAETLTSNEIRYIPPSELQPLMVSDIQLSVQPPANADGTINEGSTATFTFNVSGGTGVYQYESKIDDAEYTSFQPPFIYSIPDDLVAIESTSQIVTLTIRVSDQAGNIEAFEHTEKLHIRITNNGSADINLSITNTTLTATIGADPDGDLNFPSYTYQWQSRALGEDSPWMTIDGENDASYTISGDLASTSGEFRVQVTYTDGQGYSEMPISNAITYTRPDELPPLTVSDIQLSVQPPANADGTINEGRDVRFMVNASGGSGTYNFAWSQTSGKALVLTTTNTATLNVAIPPDFIAEDATTTTLTFTVMVDDGISTISRSKMITITKASLTISEVMLSAATIAEGSIATVTFDVSGGTGIYQYVYKLIAGEDEITLPSLTPPIDLVIPTDIVAAADSERVVELNITVSDDRGQRVEHNEELTIQKVDNGLADIEASRATSTTLTVKVGIDPDGDATDSNYAYQWQWRAAGGAQWMNIDSATDTSYTISDDLAVDGNEFRVQVSYTDKQAYQATLTSNAVRYDFLPPCTMAIADSDGDDAGATIDIDKDGDGLIELCDLEGINEMRYQLEGNGYKTSEGATGSRRGCPLVDGEEQCRGYELMQSLDFNEAASYRENTTTSEWTAGSGWLPIDADFASVFEGNGNSIANLYINRTEAASDSEQGAATAQINNIQLLVDTDFASVFEGNGNSIANLYINQTEAASGSEQGLFSTLDATAQINNIHLLDVNIKGFAQVAALSGSNSGIISNSSASGDVMANTDVGGLVGRNDGSVVSSFATVAVNANMNGGGLVGHNQGSLSDSQATGNVVGGSRLGGLSGVNSGSIISSYATATVNGTDESSYDIGGLAGHNNNVITNSYATGAVSATGNNIGGLVGFNNNGRIANTYAEGGVMGASQVGGLIGRHHGSLRDSYAALGVVSGSGSDIGGLIGIINTTATVIASYWDSDSSGQTSSAGGESRTTAELQTATAPGTTTTAVYYNWSDNDWDFGGSNPALRYASDDDLNNCVIDITTSTMALPCTILLPSQRDRDKGLDTIFFFSDDLPATVTTEPLFSPLTDSYMVTIVARAERVRLTLRPYAINPDATITVTDPTDTSYFSGKATGALSDEIPLVAETTVTIVVSDILGEDTVHTTYTFAITSELQPLMVSDIQLSVQPSANADGTIDEGSTATLTFEVSGGTDMYQYESKIDDAEYTSFQPPFIYSIADDFIAAESTSQIVTLTIRVSDQSAEIADVEHTEELHIRITNNGPADINISWTSATLTAIVGADPDGDPNSPNYQYQWQTKTGSEWMNIGGAGNASYTISGNLAETSNEFRVQVMYIDGQGYREAPISNTIRYIPPSELQPLTVSDIQLTVQPPANADGTINEGSTATITFNVSGGTGVYQYESKIDNAAYTSFEPSFIYSISDDFIATDATTQTVRLTIRVSDQSAEIEDFEHTEELHIRKTNNGSADITITEMNGTLSATVGTDPDGDPNPLSYTYQWQTNTGSDWIDIDSATSKTYAITADGEFRVQVTYTDGQGYLETSTSNAISYTQPDSSDLRIRTKVFLEGPLR